MFIALFASMFFYAVIAPECMVLASAEESTRRLGGLASAGCPPAAVTVEATSSTPINAITLIRVNSGIIAASDFYQ